MARRARTSLKRSSSGDSRRRSRRGSFIVAGCSTCTTSHSGRPSGNPTIASEGRPHRGG
jgi:hypothetical protein